MGKTSIEIDDEAWSRLNQRKERGDTFNDVVHRLLEQTEAAHANQP